MTLWPDAFVHRALGLSTARRSDTGFTAISTDSRTIPAGGLFVALSGERFDGHNYLEEVRRAGARAAIVREGTSAIDGLELIRVADTLRALGALALAHRRTIRGPVVAVTGSNGKTSTKEMLAEVLRTGFHTHATRYNLNNLVGIPQTILSAPPETEALVIEAGANLLGEIPRAREIIEPSLTVITNVAESHLEGFGSLGAIMAEKLALAAGVPLAVVGTVPRELLSRARKVAGRAVSAGLCDADCVPERVSLDAAGRPNVTIDGVSFLLPLRGEHQAANAMLAWTVARELGIEASRAAEALRQVVLPTGRGDLQQVGALTILNDCYNANPQSFRAAIAIARAIRAGRRLVFLAGSMRELGAESEHLHEEIARDLADLAPELLGVVGDFVRAIEPYRNRLGNALVTAADPLELGIVLAGRLHGDELVVLKASRGVALERIIPYLTGQAIPSN